MYQLFINIYLRRIYLAEIKGVTVNVVVTSVIRAPFITELVKV